MSNPFKQAQYNTDGNELGMWDLRANDFRTYPRKGYPNMKTRYRELDDGTIQVENWLENNVKKKGVLGRGGSRLVGRFRVVKKKAKSSRDYLKIGKATTWYWDGKMATKQEFIVVKVGNGQDDKRVFGAEFDEKGRLTNYWNSRGKCLKELRYQYDEDGKRTLVLRKGRYSKIELENGGYGSPDTLVETRAEGGKPLDEKKNFIKKTYNAKTRVLKEEERYVAGKQHGFSREFNKFGRVTTELYYVRGTLVPDWVYLDPRAVTPEEIQGEEDDELRAIMLELQGTELYQVRAMARSMKAISRTLVEQPEGAVRSEPLLIKRTPMLKV